MTKMPSLERLLPASDLPLRKLRISGGNTVAYESDIQLRLTSQIANIEYKSFEVCAFASRCSCAMIIQF